MRRERMPRLPRAAAMTVAPDWVCEVISISTARVDWVKKSRAYAREGVRHLWYIDPAQRALHVRRLSEDGEHWLELGSYVGDDQVVAEPFAEATLDLGSLWLTDEDEDEDAAGPGSGGP